MSTNTTLAPVKVSITKEVAYYADALTKSEVLKWVTIALCAVLIFREFQFTKLSEKVLNQHPIVIRVDEVGRAEAIDYKYSNYTPADKEMRHFLTEFVSGFFSRNHRLTPRDYPQSLSYLSPQRLDEVETENRKTQWFGKFMVGADDDMDVTVKNIGLDLTQKPFRAHVEYDKVFKGSNGAEIKRESWTCSLAYVVDDTLAEKKPEYVRHNPLGFQITDYRPEQAF